MTVTPMPTRAEISTFLDAFRKLECFEGQTRSIRGYGIFKPEEVPVPAIGKVIAWLKELAA